MNSLTFANQIFLEGELSEWLKEHAWKACIRETVSRVRIPHSPQSKLETCEKSQVFSLTVKSHVYLCELAGMKKQRPALAGLVLSEDLTPPIWDVRSKSLTLRKKPF
jgi:hypothetical protein